MSKVKKTIREEAGDIVAEHAIYHAVVGVDKYCIVYHGKFLVSTDTSDLADKVAELIRKEHRAA